MWVSDILCRDVRDVLKGFSLDEFMTKLEPFFRNLVRILSPFL